MGVIISAFLVAKSSIQKSRDKKKAKRQTPQETAALQPAAASQPLSHSQTQHDAAEGLQEEHLAAVPPPAVSADLEGAGTVQVERNIAVEAPLPIAATS
jgi:hypothetical protein